jgi:halocyanin-like protein
MRKICYRRKFVRAVAITSITGLVAGCSGSNTEADANQGGSSGSSAQTTPAQSEVSNYLSDSSNFDGNVIIKTSSDEVTVQVGTNGNGGTNAYSPVAIKIASGTTVTWEWVKNSGLHNVISEENGPLDSGDPVAEGGTTYMHTFSDVGVYPYYCTPHESLGMKGVIIVE